MGPVPPRAAADVAWRVVFCFYNPERACVRVRRHSGAAVCASSWVGVDVVVAVCHVVHICIYMSPVAVMLLLCSAFSCFAPSLRTDATKPRPSAGAFFCFGSRPHGGLCVAAEAVGLRCEVWMSRCQLWRGVTAQSLTASVRALRLCPKHSAALCRTNGTWRCAGWWPRLVGVFVGGAGGRRVAPAGSELETTGSEQARVVSGSAVRCRFFGGSGVCCGAPVQSARVVRRSLFYCIGPGRVCVLHGVGGCATDSLVS